MPDRTAAAAIIARRLRHVPADAAAIAELLSGDELDIVEEADRDPQGPVRIATAIFNAMLRRARRLSDPAETRAAIRAAKYQAFQHYQTICSTVPADTGHRDRNTGAWPAGAERGSTPDNNVRVPRVLRDPSRGSTLE